jgi:hypothetical protein
MVDPVWEYGRSLGNSVTGGYVYRGTVLSSLIGFYIYADYASGRIWYLDYDGTGPATNTALPTAPFFVSGFGVDESRELFVIQYAGTGKIHRLVQTEVSP